jgi:uncharacterized protein
MLEIGYNTSFEIKYQTVKAAIPSPVSIMYISDLHCRSYSKNIISQLAEKIHDLDPDVILLGGDYVDSVKGLQVFDAFLKALSGKAVFAIAGNHDYYFGIERIRNAIERHGGRWIEKDSVLFQINDTSIRIDGNAPFDHSKKADLNILCLHRPRNISTWSRKYQVTYAGHLHGGQIVMWTRRGKLYPAAMFYPLNFLRAEEHGSVYLISKGMGDTLPVRWNCPKDIIFTMIE